MSRVVLNQLPTIRLAAETLQKKKRRQLLKVCCDKDFVRAICEYCWNIVNQRVKLSPLTRNRLVKHKKLLRDISDKTLSQKRKRTLIQSGGFASVLPYLLGPIISGITSLIRRRK